MHLESLLDLSVRRHDKLAPSGQFLMSLDNSST